MSAQARLGSSLSYRSHWKPVLQLSATRQTMYPVALTPLPQDLVMLLRAARRRCTLHMPARYSACRCCAQAQGPQAVPLLRRDVTTGSFSRPSLASNTSLWRWWTFSCPSKKYPSRLEDVVVDGFWRFPSPAATSKFPRTGPSPSLREESVVGASNKTLRFCSAPSQRDIVRRHRFRAAQQDKSRLEGRKSADTSHREENLRPVVDSLKVARDAQKRTPKRNNLEIATMDWYSI
ncbi:hypothetical protein CPLU01_08254 [Colletotrichum plurivorum]|uniref:Uncharacterized protein n=1 Tax=Colletotrichum plurivorum TaxID=2175906 RepID=A0A8H6KCT5_9PEZI|nr:hypothetical protein CPLU01_08254 [Colletotrichum plurivorum]